MTNQIYILRSTSLRDGLSVVFRRKWLVLLCVVATISAALFAALVLPRYHGEAKILVNRERVDPILSPTPEMGNFAQPIVTDEDLRSEVEIMRSTEVLSEVVKEMGLIHSGEASWWSRHVGHQPSDEEKISAKVAQLSHDLVIEPAKGSYIIDVVYKSKDREFAKRLMDKLIQVYLAKHTEVQHPAGQFKFFEQETGEYRDKMAAAEARLAEFPVNSGTVAPAMDRELTMQKLAEFKFSLGQARAAVAETEQRIQRLQQQEGSTPDRITTAVRKADNPQLLGELKSSLLSLELKRADLITKYQPDYRPVKEIDQQIAQARADIQHELSSPMRDETTDLDATHQMVRSDLAKAQADLAGYKARVQTTENIVNSYSERARELDAKSLLQADLERTFKAEEDNYLLYRKKTEEARITDALDANHMVNLAVVEKPLVPGLPSHSPVFFAVLAFMTMTTASVGLIGSLEYMDRTFHTPRQLEAYLDVPVLASVPRQLGPG
jgi:uncharacterized protein involved in exopolysaccharide biosynthesis